jgi:hypothetical protein
MLRRIAQMACSVVSIIHGCQPVAFPHLESDVIGADALVVASAMQYRFLD